MVDQSLSWVRAGVAAAAVACLWGDPFVSVCRAEEKVATVPKGSTPEWMSMVRTAPPGAFPLIPASSLSYNVSWNGVLKAGETRLVFLPAAAASGAALRQSLIRTVSTSRSVGAARLLWPYDARVDSTVRPKGFLPESVNQWEEDRAEENLYRTTFTPGMVLNEWTTIPKKSGENEEERQRAFPLEPVHDLVSSMLYLRSFPWDTPGEDLTLIVFPFRDPYLATATFIGRERRKVDKDTADVLRFGLRLSKIEKDGSLKSIDKEVKAAHFWLTDDALRLPLELRAEVFVGDIRVVLDDYAPMSDSADLATARDADAESILASTKSKRPGKVTQTTAAKGKAKPSATAREREAEAKRTKR